MKKEPISQLDKYRVNNHPALPETPSGASYGFFRVPLRGAVLAVMSSGSHNGSEWEHVSVSTQSRCPTWEELCIIKDMFWGEDETVIQFHPKKSNYVNVHKYCLHLWKNTRYEHTLPPEIFVG